MADGNQQKPPGAGKSSFDLIDAEKLFAELDLQPTSVFLDLGCGRGAYTLAAARRIGGKGLVYGIDLWSEGIAALHEQADAEDFSHVRAMVGDAGNLAAVPNGSVDICLLGTVLHDLVQTGVARAALEEIAKVLKPNGTLAVVEFKKIEGPPGPPVTIRMAPAEVERQVAACGFTSDASVDLGPYNYLLKCTLNAAGKAP